MKKRRCGYASSSRARLLFFFRFFYSFSFSSNITYSFGGELCLDRRLEQGKGIIESRHMMSIYTGVGGHDVLIRQRWEYRDRAFFPFLFFLPGHTL